MVKADRWIKNHQLQRVIGSQRCSGKTPLVGKLHPPRAGCYLVLAGFHLRIARRPLQVAAQTDADRGVRLGALMRPLCGRQAVISSQGPGTHGGGRCGTERRQGEGVPADPRPSGLQFVGQDKLPQFGSPGVALRGNVHVGRVGTKQPGAPQAEGDALPAAMHLQDTGSSQLINL